VTLQEYPTSRTGWRLVDVDLGVAHAFRDRLIDGVVELLIVAGVRPRSHVVRLVLAYSASRLHPVFCPASPALAGFAIQHDPLPGALGHPVKGFPSLWVEFCGEKNALALGAEALTPFALIGGIHEASGLPE
jgi:hypothetical protein